MAQEILTLPVVLVPSVLRSNIGRNPNYRVTLNAAYDTSTYTLRLPRTSEAGYLYNNGVGLCEWRSATTATEIKDSEFRIIKDSDPTAKMKFSVTAISPFTTRTIWMPDVDIDLNIVDMVKNLTVAEISQLENIGTNTITPTQWAYLSALDQGISTISNVTFNTVTVSSTILAFLEHFQVGTIDGTARSQLWYWGTNDADPSNILGGYSGKGSICRIGACEAMGDLNNIISEGFESYGIPASGGPMAVDNYSKVVLHPNRLELHDFVVADTVLFSVDTTGVKWRNAGAASDVFTLGTTLMTLTVPLLTSGLRLKGPAADYVAITAAPSATYTVPLPADPIAKLSYMQTDGMTSTWVEEEALTTNVDLYQYPATYSISGGGANLKTSIATNGGGTLVAPKVYEVVDSLAYDAGIDLTNKSHIVIRGAVGQRPSILVGTGGNNGIQILYTAVVHGTTTNVTIGNITFNNTAVGIFDQNCLMFWRQAGALVGDTIGTIGIKDILCVNTDYASTSVSRGGLVVLDDQGDGGFWMTNLYLENSVMRNQTPFGDRGAPQLMGIQNYIGKYNAFLYPGLTTYAANISERYYWIRGSNVRELYSYFSRAAYTGNAASKRFMIWISQDNLYSSWNNVCSIEFDQCSFSNAIEPTNGAIVLRHEPTGTPGGALQSITLNVHDCTFTDIRGQGILIMGDGIIYANLIDLLVKDNTFIQCDSGVIQDASYVSGFSALVIERNKYDRCLSTDSGFAMDIQQAVGVDLVSRASMYQYLDLIDYTLWAPSSAAYFVTTATFAEGAWYNVTFTDGLPSVGWLDAGISNRASVNTATGVITVLEDGIFAINYSINVSNPEAAKLIWESYCVIDAESPPVAGPTTSLQRYKLSPIIQTSALSTIIQPYRAELYLRLMAGQTISLAIRWVATDPSPPSGVQAFYIQGARMDVIKTGI